VGRIRIVTDSAARFPNPAVMDHADLVIAPMLLRGSNGAIPDAPGSDLETFRHLFLPGSALPVAEPPSPDAFADLYRRLTSETDQIISIHSSSGMSAAVNNATLASQQFLGRAKIQIIDSQTISVGLGIAVQAAVAAAEAGRPFDEVVRVVRGMLPRIYLVFFLDDLTYLEHNGLVTRSQAVLGNMLGVLPFLTIEQGRLVPMEKVRSRPRALEKLVEFVSEFSELEHLGLLFPGSTPHDEARQLADRIQALHPSPPLSLSAYGPVTATFVGLTGLGVVVMDMLSPA
jgi:DegV family protein with EDD domain